MDEILSNEHGYVSEYHGKWHAFTSRAKVYKNPVRTVGNGKSVFGPNGQMLLYLDYLEVGQYAADGKSLRELISGTDTTHGQFVVTEWDYRGDKEPNYMIVEDGWKLLLPYSKESNVLNALYDLNSDPHEMHNLLRNNPTRALHQEKAEQLKENLLRWLHQTHSRHYEGVHSRSLL
tara:strand:- start:1926 stop:2453 length:528 start_codon:yes stop_codon:yes gene_type:complete